jgi:RND family efflux transporter MFP subunit
MNNNLKMERKEIPTLVAYFMIIVCMVSCNNKHGDKPDKDLNQSVKVKVQQIATSSGSTEQPYIGMIEESSSVPLSFLISGNADKVMVSEGQDVRKGQLLAVINSGNYQNAYQIAVSKERQATDAYNRLETMYKSGSLPEVKFVEIQTGLEQARSMVAISKKNLNDCKLYSPTNGTIGKRMIEPGMSIIPGNPVFQLVKIEKVYATVPIPENEIATIKKGQKATISVSALGNKSFEGTIEEKGVMSNPLSHTYKVKITMNNPQKLLQPGMVCNVIIHNNNTAGKIVVPADAIQIDQKGQKYIFVADGNKVVKKNVETGPPYKNGVIITSGLQPGDQLIIEGYQKVSENTTIQIVK